MKISISESGEERIAQLLEKGIKPTVCPVEDKRCLVPCEPERCTCVAHIWGEYTIVSPETADMVIERIGEESWGAYCSMDFPLMRRLTEELNKDRHTNDTV